MLQSASCGVLLIALGRLVTFYGLWFDGGKRVASLLAQIVPDKEDPYFGTALVALLIGWGGAHAINIILGLAEKIPFLKVKPLKLRIVERYDNGLLKLFHDAMYMEHPLSVTLSNRKVYVGYVAEPPTDSPQDSYFTLLLLVSGYRNETTMSFVQDINYADRTVLEGEKEEPLAFFITLSMTDVVSANFFDLNIYQQHFADRQMVLTAR